MLFKYQFSGILFNFSKLSAFKQTGVYNCKEFCANIFCVRTTVSRCFIRFEIYKLDFSQLGRLGRVTLILGYKIKSQTMSSLISSVIFEVLIFLIGINFTCDEM